MHTYKLLSFLILSFGFLIWPLAGYAEDAPQVDAMALTGGPVSSDVQTGKDSYTLFNPTPDDQMRSFSTDRPGKTHSSTTVDAGHFQVESDFVNYTYDRFSPNRQTTQNYSIATPIIKVGVTNWADVEAGFALYNHSRVKDRGTGATTKGSGFGDFLLGSKINIFGNDGGRQALALLPFIKIPTAASNVGNGVTEFTLNVPYAINLDSLWSITLEPALGYLKNYNDNGLHGDYSFLVNLNRPIFDPRLIGALEVASEYSADRNITPRYTLDPSLQWLVTPTVQLDVGIYLGLNKAAPDYNPYTGISFRF